MMQTKQPSKGTASAMIASVTSLHRRRSDVATHEPEDAEMTGMTRSLERRLLALNLPPGITSQRSLPAANAA